MARPVDRAVALALAALILASVVLAFPGGEVVSTDRRASATRFSPSGVRALYLALEELGVPVALRMSPLVDGPPVPGALALLDPTEPLSPREVGALVDRVRRGGALVYVPAPGDALLDTLGLELRAWWEVVDRDEIPLREMLGGARSLMDVDTLPAGVWTVGVRRHPWTAGSEGAGRFRRVLVPAGDGPPGPTPPGGTPLLADGDTLLFAVLLPLGSGWVLALSDVRPVTNARIRESGVATFVARAARGLTPPGDSLVFDEYHHGVRGGSLRSGLAGFFRSHPMGRGLLQLAAVLLLGLVAAARRFGAPRTVPPIRRSPLEHVDALARAYRESGAERLPRLLLIATLARHTRRPRPREEDEARTLLGRLRGAVPAARDALDRLENALDGSEDLMTTSAAVDRVAGELKR